MSQALTHVFFRNDDAADDLAGLAELGRVFAERGLPLAHSVIPSRLSPPVADWLRDQAVHEQMVIQHGWDHVWRERGEFGGKRTGIKQLADILRGKEILESAFGPQFFPAMAFPWHLYSDSSLWAIAQAGFSVVSGIFRPTPTRRAFFALGRALGAQTLMGRNVSWHGGRRPDQGPWEISVSVDPVIKYAKPPQDAPHHDLAGLQNEFRAFAPHSPLLGVLLHHEFYTDPARLEVVAGFLDWLTQEPGVFVVGLGQARNLLERQA
jgi:hypothetical protein